MNSNSPVVVRRDPLAIIAFVLALFIMVLPLEADILDPLFRRGHFGLAALSAAFFFALVFIPFFLGLRHRRREPQAWSGRGYLIATGLILILNVVWFSSIIIFRLSR